eukprot:COSAG05_NODE_3456_length_2050_cov_187.722706_2_plen_65_part_00
MQLSSVMGLGVLSQEQSLKMKNQNYCDIQRDQSAMLIETKRAKSDTWYSKEMYTECQLLHAYSL